MTAFILIVFVIFGLVAMKVRSENIATGKTKRKWHDL